MQTDEERKRKAREKQRRKRANRMARDPVGYAAKTAERLAHLRANYEPSLEAKQRHRKKRRVARNAKNRVYTQERRSLIAGSPRPEVCEVCGATDVQIDFDHCHKTDKFRGWLCAPCNHTLGNVKDRPETLRALAVYLESFQLREPTLPTISAQRKPRPRKPPYALKERDWLLVDSSFYTQKHKGSRLESFL